MGAQAASSAAKVPTQATIKFTMSKFSESQLATIAPANPALMLSQEQHTSLLQGPTMVSQSKWVPVELSFSSSLSDSLFSVSAGPKEEVALPLPPTLMLLLSNHSSLRSPNGKNKDPKNHNGRS